MSRPLSRVSHGLYSGHRAADFVPYERFLETCQLSGVVEPHREQIWTVIQQNYTDASRVYHNLEHVMSLFEFIRFATKAGVVLQDPAAVDWAVWFHDVVYDPRSDTNEADSAQLAGELLTAAGLPAATVEKVKQYILVTADHHHIDGDDDCDVFVDADLSILGSPLQRYAEYAVAIRQEYSHLIDADYCVGRARVLKRMLDREQLFLTDVGKSACEAAARANMSHEWRLAFGGSLLTNALEEPAETIQEGTELSTSVSLASTGGVEAAAAADS